jgi:erythromycin esterase
MRALWRKLLPLTLSALVVAGTAGVTTLVRADTPAPPSIRDGVLDLRSLDPADTDVSDLDRWAPSLDGVRVVLLGEATLSEGGAYLAKARLVRYLHQRLGFDVLAFESGFYDCHRAQQLIDAGADPVATTARCVHGVWSGSQEFQPTLRYIAETTGSDRPLRVTGFDSRFTGEGPAGTPWSDVDFVDRLDAYATARGAGMRADPERWKRVRQVAEQMLGDREFGPHPAPADRPALLAAVLSLSRQLGSGGDATARFWAQSLRSLAGQARYAWGLDLEALTAAAMNPRDAQMADNLTWLLENPYRGYKVIVWAATFHGVRDMRGVAGTAHGVVLRNTVPMGAVLARRYGRQMYTLGVSTYEGTRTGDEEPTQPVPPAPAGSLEADLHDAGVRDAIVDFRRLRPPSRAVAAQPRLSRQFGYTSDTGAVTADWTRALDGVLHIDRMTPATPLPPTS